jgi:hypothetical protein
MLIGKKKKKFDLVKLIASLSGNYSLVLLVPNTKLSFCELEAKEEKWGCVFVKKGKCFIVKDLHCIQFHLAEDRGKTGNKIKQLQTALEGGNHYPSLVPPQYVGLEFLLSGCLTLR